MTDQPNNHTAGDDNRLPAAWTMPEPVFRTTEGVTPKNRRRDIAADEPTDPESLAASEPAAEEPVGQAAEDPADKASRIKVIPAQPKTKKNGWALPVMGILILGVIGLTALVLVLAYFYYSTPPADPFR